MQNGQHRAIGNRVQQLIRLPCGRQRAGFRFTVADNAGNDQLRIVERRAEGMAQGIAQLAAFVDRTGRCRRHMAGNAARKRKLLEQLFQPGFVLRNVRVHLGPGAFEIHIANQGRAAVTGTGDIDDVQIMLFDHPIEVNIDEILARRRSPMAHHQRLDMSKLQLLTQQRIVIKIDLSHGQVVCGPPVGVCFPQFLRSQGRGAGWSLPRLDLMRRGRCVHFFSASFVCAR